MRSKIEAKIQRSPTRKKPKSPVGGKALQRLFFYLGERDPRLNDEIVAATAPPKAPRPKFGLTKRAMRAAVARRPRRAAPAAKPLATAMAKAATALTARRRRARPSRRRARAAAPAAAAVWQSIGPSLIP